jgi:DNA-binding response OmpR family regulator
MQNILLVEDDLNLSADIKAQLQDSGLNVETVYDGLLAEKMIGRNKYDCIILDVNIPGKTGYDVCRSIRQQNIKTPVIILTAFGEIDDKLEGFNCGADDYLTKPFYFKELLARTKVFLRRAETVDEIKNIVISDLHIDLSKKIVSRNNVQVKLTPREFEIVLLLARAKGNPVSKKDLIKNVWGTTMDVNTNTIEVFINLIRNKIDKNQEVKLLHTRPGFGYYLTAEQDENQK